MSLYECNIHMGNVAHGSLGHAIEKGQVMGSHVAFSIQYEINGGMWHVIVT